MRGKTRFIIIHILCGSYGLNKTDEPRTRTEFCNNYDKSPAFRAFRGAHDGDNGEVLRMGTPLGRGIAPTGRNGNYRGNVATRQAVYAPLEQAAAAEDGMGGAGVML